MSGIASKGGLVEKELRIVLVKFLAPPKRDSSETEGTLGSLHPVEAALVTRAVGTLGANYNFARSEILLLEVLFLQPSTVKDIC